MRTKNDIIWILEAEINHTIKESGKWENLVQPKMVKYYEGKIEGLKRALEIAKGK